MNFNNISSFVSRKGTKEQRRKEREGYFLPNPLGLF